MLTEYIAKHPILMLAVALSVIAVAVLIPLVRRAVNNTLRQALLNLAAENVFMADKSANFFGLESKGAGQVRGNGVLVLTDHGLRFRMWVPKRIINIDWQNVQKVETAKWHLGKSKGRPLIKITFTNDSGQQDSAAWLVKNHELFLDAVRGRINI